MLNQKNRLKKETDFDKVHRKGQFFPGKYLVIKTLKNNSDYSRFGIVVGNKIAKSAVKRSKIKRRLREILRLALKKDKIKPGFDIIIITKPSIVKENYVSIEKNVRDVFYRAGLVL